MQRLRFTGAFFCIAGPYPAIKFNIFVKTKYKRDEAPALCFPDYAYLFERM